MFGKNMQIALIFKAINQGTGAVFGRINNSLREMNKLTLATSKRFEHLSNIGKRLTIGGAGMSLAGGRGLGVQARLDRGF